MSATEIFNALSKLTPDEIRLVRNRLLELAAQIRTLNARKRKNKTQ